MACGTSYHAGLIGRYALEEWARIPVEMDIASEYRYRNPVVGPGDLVIGITQSGETADTLAAMRLARERGATVLAVTNIMGSQATRDADGVLLTRAGLEVCVAATKTFVAQVAGMYLLALRMAELRGTLPASRLAELVAELKRIPHAITEITEGSTAAIDAIAEQIHAREFFLYLGRHVGLAVGLEGALKLKEISYISTDAYAAGEMKHGPIALLEDGTPVVVVATDSPVIEKVVSNMQEVRARGAHVIAVVTEGDGRAEPHADEVAEGAGVRLDAAADPRGDPAAAAGLPDRPAARAQRGPAAQPGEDRHRRVARVDAGAWSRCRDHAPPCVRPRSVRGGRARLCLRAALEKPVDVGVVARLRPVGDVELPVDVRQVVLDRLLGHPERLGDASVGRARRDHLEDLQLARGEPAVARLHPSRSGGEGVVDLAGRDRRDEHRERHGVHAATDGGVRAGLDRVREVVRGEIPRDEHDRAAGAAERASRMRESIAARACISSTRITSGRSSATPAPTASCRRGGWRRDILSRARSTCRMLSPKWLL